ncbi:MAG: protein kinase [Thiobacillaceae bacterium]|jgi:serine/threonine-protein kinase|nr:protein kinase [Thiobacillaceae bacterium]
MRIGRYEILEPIGEGAMGKVFRARDPLIERTVAIKTVSTTQLQSEGPEFESRFLREAQSAGRLSHPNIVTIYDVGETDDVAYIAMEYLPGTTLRELMDKGPMPLDLVLDTAIQMAEALAFAHEHGVIHRDIKPANVIISGPRGRIKLTDFGIAHFSSNDRTHAGLMLGSPRYMSPEQAMGREVSGSTDIFSLGAVLYEMVTGECAFGGDSLPSILYRVINEMPVAPNTRRQGLPDPLAKILMRMLQKNPDARPDAQGLIAAFRKMLTPPPASEEPSPEPSPVPALLPVIAFATPVLVMLLIALGIIVISFFINTSEQGAVAENPNMLSKPVMDESAAQKNDKADAAEPSPPAAASTRRSRSQGYDAYLSGLDRKKTELELQRTELLLKYTEQHPDVVLIDRQIEQLAIERRNYLQQRRR